MDEPALRRAIREPAETSADQEWSSLLALNATDPFGDKARRALGEFVGNWARRALCATEADVDRASIVAELCDRIRDSLTADSETPAYLCAFGPKEIEAFLNELLHQIYPSGDAPRVATDAESGWSRIYAALMRDAEDSSAWRDLEARVRTMARSHFWHLTAAIEDDLAGETVARVFVGLPQAHGAESFGAFVYGHFRNVKKALINRLRRNEQPIGDIDIPAPSLETPNSESLSMLEECLEQMEDRGRRAIHLAFWEDANSEQIALTLGVTNVNARQILWRAKARLRRCVEAHANIGGSDSAACQDSA